MLTMTHGSLICPPRFGTPRAERATLGGQAGLIARRLRRPFLPWQQHVADVALEVDCGGRLVHREVNLVVPRQQGKTELKFVVAVCRLTAMARELGPQRATYTMQNRQKARTRLERDYAQRLRGASGFKEIAAVSRRRPTQRTEWRLGMAGGAEHIQFGPDCWLQIDTPTRVGMHGDTLDLGLIDEAFAHEDDTVEVGMEPPMLTRTDAQLWVLSAAGDEKSAYLYRKIQRGRKLGPDSSIAYFEWSAEDEADPGSPSVWRACMPAMGFLYPESTIEALWLKALETGPEAIDAFRRSYLCQWPRAPQIGDMLAFKVIPAEIWKAAENVRSGPVGQVAFALDVSPSRDWASFGVAGRSGLGGEHIELVERQPGTAWLPARAKELQERWGGLLAVAEGSPAWSLVPELEAGGVDVLGIPAREHAQACGALYDGLVEGRIHHLGQPELTNAVGNAAQRFYGDSWLWARRIANSDISALVACTLALWVSRQNVPDPAFVDLNDFGDE